MSFLHLLLDGENGLIFAVIESSILLCTGNGFGRSITFGVDGTSIDLRAPRKPPNESGWLVNDFIYLLVAVFVDDSNDDFCRMVFGVAGVSKSLFMQQQIEQWNESSMTRYNLVPVD